MDASGVPAEWLPQPLADRSAALRGVVACCLLALAATYLTGESGGTLNTAVYFGVASAAVCGAAYGAWRWRRELGVVGLLVVASVLAGFIGDAGYTVNVQVLDQEPFPAWTDALYLLAYLFMIAAVTVMVRRRDLRRDLAALIDAAIIAVSVAVVAYVFVVVGVATDPSLSWFARVVTMIYPLCDVLVVGVVVRLLVSTGAATSAAVFLVTAMSVLLIGDVGFAVAVFNGYADDYGAWIDATYLAYYLLVALALLRPDTGRLTEPAGQRTARLSRVRLAALGCATLLAPLTMLGGGVAGDVLKVRGAAAGAAILFLLAMMRMALLIRAVEFQSDLLSVLARTDGLTGLANRRSFDYELKRTTDQVGYDPRLGPVSLAMIDLDRFKTFNDTYGHSAGDQLLRQAAAAWSEVLDRIAPSATLARYGGEEFAVIMPGVDEDTGAVLTHALLSAMPLGQTFSAGVAQRDDDEDLAAFVGRADARLYAAKEVGRACIVVGRAPVDLRVSAPPGECGTPAVTPRAPDATRSL